MAVTPYLSFDGRADEAIEFYKKALGATVGMLMRFKDAPQGMCSPGSDDKVMHASLSINGATVMLSDGYNKGHPEFKGVSLSLDAKDEAQAEKMFAALSEGGQIGMPMDKTFFAKKFGMVTDKFGVAWMVIAE